MTGMISTKNGGELWQTMTMPRYTMILWWMPSSADSRTQMPSSSTCPTTVKNATTATRTEYSAARTLYTPHRLKFATNSKYLSGYGVRIVTESTIPRYIIRLSLQAADRL